MTCPCQVKHGIDKILIPTTLFTAGCKVEPLGSLRCIGVSTTPGATAFKRMPSFAYSIARFWVTEFKAPFVIIETVPFTAIGRSASAAAKLTAHPDSNSLAFANIEKAAKYYNVNLSQTSWHDLGIHPRKNRTEAAAQGAVTRERRV